MAQSGRRAAQLRNRSVSAPIAAARVRLPVLRGWFAFGISAFALPARASLFSGDTLDAVANVLAWVVLFIAPVIAIGVFLGVHILPEKIAEKRKHPQLSAIKTLCLLSLVFGGMLWPLAWLWAYTKPVIHKLAYGTDVHDQEETPEIVVVEQRERPNARFAGDEET